jgi:hypothetical protein
MKPIGRENYTIRPFKAFKRHTYSLEFLESQSDSFSVYEAERPPVGWEKLDQPLGDLNFDSIVFKRSLYVSVLHMFYAPYSNTINSRRPAEFDRKFNPDLLSSFYVVAVNQQAFGERIKPGTFSIKVNGGEDTITDDGEGHLLYNGDEEVVVGNIFYSEGIAVISDATADVIEDATTTTTDAPPTTVGPTTTTTLPATTTEPPPTTIGPTTAPP